MSEFISFITSEACEKCRGGNRKTINGDDLLYSLNQLGFDRYIENLNLYYTKYKDAQKLMSDKHPSSETATAQEAIMQSMMRGSAPRQAEDVEEEEMDEEYDDEEAEEEADEGDDDDHQ